MYIRRTTIKSRQTGEPYYTYRLVESIREGERVRQRTLLNLGRYFEVPRAQWAALVQRIEHLLGGQADWLPGDLDAQWEEVVGAHVRRITQYSLVSRDELERDRFINANWSSKVLGAGSE